MSLCWELCGGFLCVAGSRVLEHAPDGLYQLRGVHGFEDCSVHAALLQLSESPDLLVYRVDDYAYAWRLAAQQLDEPEARDIRQFQVQDGEVHVRAVCGFNGFPAVAGCQETGIGKSIAQNGMQAFQHQVVVVYEEYCHGCQSWS